MDKELRVNRNIDCFCSGTTAVTLVKQGKRLVVGNIGDSRAVLGTQDQNDSLIAVQLTVDLKPNLPNLLPEGTLTPELGKLAHLKSLFAINTMQSVYLDEYVGEKSFGTKHRRGNSDSIHIWWPSLRRGQALRPIRATTAEARQPLRNLMDEGVQASIVEHLCAQYLRGGLIRRKT